MLTATSSLEFAQVARVIGRVARHHNLVVPGFRSPPREGSRSLRRYPDGSSTIAVAIKDRPLADVVADMIDGVLEANHATDRLELRLQLLEAVQ